MKLGLPVASPGRAARPALLAAVLVAALMLSAAGARAGDRQVSIFEDDAALIYQPPAQVARALQQLRRLGVEVLRVQVNWQFLAPSPDVHTAPSLRSLRGSRYVCRGRLDAL